MEAESSLEKKIGSYEVTRRHTPEDFDLHHKRSKNFKSPIKLYLSSSSNAGFLNSRRL
jgi:hypothetical protein